LGDHRDDPRVRPPIPSPAPPVRSQEGSAVAKDAEAFLLADPLSDLAAEVATEIVPLHALAGESARHSSACEDAYLAWLLR
jgi:hypothetical protein